MRILAIETSCDETAVAILECRGSFADAEVSVLAEEVNSQIEEHREFGGVYPTVAKREHGKNLVPLIVKALQHAGLFKEATYPLSPEQLFSLREKLSREPELFSQFSSTITTLDVPDIDGIAVTTGPGLEPALWVGINCAKALAEFWDLPLIPVDHMEGHIFSAFFDTNGKQFSSSGLAFPMLSLLVSGGHTELVLMRDWLDYEVLGTTKDDAVGEAFDKVARLLDLPYPGGPEISRLAAYAREHGIEPLFELPRPMENTTDYDFSYAGLKTAVRYKLDEYESLSDDARAGVARAFGEAAIEPLIAKTRRAIEAYAPKTLVGAGGVTANTYFRNALETLAEETEISLALSPKHLATDNAVMIGTAGYFRALSDGYTAADNISAHGRTSLAD